MIVKGDLRHIDIDKFVVDSKKVRNGTYIVENLQELFDITLVSRSRFVVTVNNYDINDLASSNAPQKILLYKKSKTTFTNIDWQDVNSWLDISYDQTLVDHINNTSNPHSVTKTQVGLSNVDNTSDIDKPISTATQNALNLKLNITDFTTHTSDSTIHFTKSSINHSDIGETGTNTHAQIDTFIGTKGQANGLATLDGTGKLTLAQLPTSVFTFNGSWDASTNTPTLTNGVGTTGDLYIVSVGGSIDLGSGSITFAVSDQVIYDGSVWIKNASKDSVLSVFGRSGVVTAQSGDYTSDQVTEGSTNLYNKVVTGGTLQQSLVKNSATNYDLSWGYSDKIQKNSTTSYIQALSDKLFANIKLDMNSNNIENVGVLSSNVTTGTAPFTIASTTVNTNLNSDLLDDQHGTYYLNYNNFSNTPIIPDNIWVLNGVLAFYNDGNVGIGTNTPNYKLHVVGTSYLGGKITSPRTKNVLTSTATVSINFTSWNIENLTITQNTTFNITGNYANGDIVSIIVNGDYLVSFVQSGFVFIGDIDESNVLLSYNGLKKNIIQIECVDSVNSTFVVINSELK